MRYSQNSYLTKYNKFNYNDEKYSYQDLSLNLQHLKLVKS